MKSVNELVKNIVFSASEINECFETEGKAFYWIKNSVQSGRIAKIRQGLYALINPATGLIYADKFMLGSNINNGAYIAYHGALEFHGYANQVFNNVFVSTNERFYGFEYGGITYDCVTGMIEDGVMTVKSTCNIRITDLERTIVDCIDNIERAGGAEELLAALSFIKKLDCEKLLIYLAAYDKKNLWQKAGYLMEKLNSTLKLHEAFFITCKTSIGKRTVYFLNDGSYGAVAHNKTWNIIAPISLGAEVLE